MPSIIILLSKVHNIGIQNNKIVRMINGCVKWILAQENSNNEFPNIYPSIIDNGIKCNPARLSWCYGDLGISLAFYQAGKALKSFDLIEIGRKLALTCSRIRGQENIIPDAQICHGTLGNAHFLNRLFYYYQEEEIREASIIWLEASFLKPKDNHFGILQTWNNNDNSYSIRDGILNGTSGMGLCLISFFSQNEPTWDRSLLLS